MITVSSSFDSGAIDIVDLSDPTNIRLNIRKDLQSDFRQWFCFRVTAPKNKNYLIRLCNYRNTSYPDGFDDYNALVSTDFEKWERVPCKIDGNEFCISYTSSTDLFYVSYFEPYTWDRHVNLLGFANNSEISRLETWGITKENRPIDAIIVDSSERDNPKKVWLIARQHPGETMAEFFMEGFIKRILDQKDKASSELRRECSFYLVPNMNPDGSVNGNLRTNSSGKNLNREWLNPDPKDSPEVFCVRNRMHQLGVDCFFDIHGEEAIPYVFTDPCIINSEGRSGLGFMTQEEKVLLSKMEQQCTNFQCQVGYTPGHYSKEEIMSMARGYVQEFFSCPSITLEMPFKDHTPKPNPVTGWNSERSMELGREWIDGLLSYFKGN